MIDFGDIIFWPFMALGFGAMMLIGILFLIFWIWMIIDSATRKYRDDIEKVIWVILILFTGWIGALVYFFVIKMNNPKGLMRRK